MDERSLQGRTVAVPETRELEVFATMLERRGATVIRCPLVSIKDAPDPEPVLAWSRDFAAGACEDLILLTGEGLRRILSCIDRHAPDIRAAFLEALKGVRKITRGPKPARVLRELGLKSDIAAVSPTTEGVIESLRDQNLAGRKVGVQLYGTEPNVPLVSFLESAGAIVKTVAPYVYSDAADDATVRSLVERMSAGQVDVIAFTSTPQVERLFSVADEALIKSALEKTTVAAVGPVVAETLTSRGIRVELMPIESFFMKPLTATLESGLEEALARRS